MAALNTQLPTLLDHATRMDPNGAIASIVEALTQNNAFLEDAVFLEGNLPTGHVFTSRTALPSVSAGWRRFNEGIDPGKSRTDQVTETTGMLEALSAVDVELAGLNGNEAAFRASEDKAFLQSLNNEVETGLIYHNNTLNPERFMGFAPRLAATANAGGNQIVKCHSAASGNDQTSMWLVCWGPETVFGIYPKGTQAGIKVTDMGKQIWTDSNSKRFLAYVTNWNWKIGLCVRDFRYLVRIANIDTGTLTAAGGGGETEDTLVPSMIKAYAKLKDTKTGRAVFYCNRTVYTYLWLQARNFVKNATITIDMVEGKPILKFQGIPVRMTDAIVNTESPVV